MFKVCEHISCDRGAYARGWCLKHYKRWRRNGSIYALQRSSPDSTLLERFLSTGWTEVDEGCWEWSGGRKRFGHGYVTYKGKDIPTHRLAYETWVGPIPEGHVVRHKCDNPPCINPDHLETGTHADNSRDMVERDRFFSKLTREDVIEIRQGLTMPGISQYHLADAYGVSASTISRINTNDHWRHV